MDVHPKHRASLLVAIVLCVFSAYPTPQATAQSNPTTPSLDQSFHTPPPTAKPWVMWMWLRVQTTHAAITRDLEEMHAKGIEGAILYDSGVGGHMEADSRMVLRGKGYERVKTDDYRDAHFTPIPLPPLQTWSPESNDLLRFTAGEAARIGIKLLITEGLAGTSGNLPPKFGQQRLLWSETAVTGPSTFNAKLPDPLTIVHRGTSAPQSFVSADPDAKPNPDSHDIAVLAIPDRPDFLPTEVIRIPTTPAPDGTLHWTVPPGKWKIIRFAYAPTGKTNAWGLFTDAMSEEALDATWNITLGQVLHGMTPAQRRGLYGIEDDSWEAGDSTWTKLFAPEFQQLRGYDLISWLPAVAGKHIGSPAEREGVLRDYDRTIADLIAKHHYAHLNDIAKRNNLILYAEAAGPNSSQLDPLLDSGNVAVPMGEFWMPSQHRATLDRRFLARESANAAHVYGKPFVACEALTSVGPFWEENFLDMKITADQAFADGCNRLAIHNFSHSPAPNAYPGYVYFAGTLYSRTTTWWQQTPAFNTYLGRNQLLLQAGLFVADALYYRGDAIGQIEQRKTIPTLPAPGYDHDNANLDVLLHRLSANNGRLTLPDGMSYRLLVLADDAPMPLEALQAIQHLLAEGATIVGPRPRGPAGLVTVPAKVQSFAALAARLWATESNATPPGKVWTVSVAEALNAIHLPPDFTFTGLSDKGEIDWIHRRAGTTDIYLVASRWDSAEKITATFRVRNMQPELWNPVTGETRAAIAFRQIDGHTEIPLEFDPRGSVYIVFRMPIAPNASGSAATNYPTIRPLRELTGPWQVAFDPKWGGPANVTFDSLVDWTKRPEDGIRHYSGTAVYRKTFDLAAAPAKGTRLLLDLGEVHEEATVKLNGVDLGVVWTKPARIDITNAAQAGTNTLEIAVVNLWPNRLIGDESLPESARFTITNAHKFSAATPLLPSGLIGPVLLQQEHPAEARVPHP